MHVGAVILAAGAASRMGRIKQLLPYRGQTLVEHSIHQAEQARLGKIVVVLGAEAGLVGEAVARTSADPVVNETWFRGMGSSVTCGVIRMLSVAPEVEAIAILLADQPHVDAAHISDMLNVFENGASAVLAASYAGTLGVPAIFGKSVFPQLLRLAPEAGARLLLRGNTDVVGYDLPEAATDVDTPDDFFALR